MRTGLALSSALVLTASALLAGCSQTGTSVPRRASLGTLKSSLSHLEFENEQLRREVAQLKTDSRDIEDRLVQEESENGTLKAKLDDARHLLSQRGYDFGDDRPSSLSQGSGGRGDSASTLPAGQSSRKRRKPPFTRIPGRIEAVDPADDDQTVAPSPPARDDVSSRSSLFSDQERWLPIAQGTTSGAAAKKGAVR